MTKVILDTDILSEYLKGYDQSVVEKAAAYGATHDQFTFTSVTVYELISGLESKGATSQLQKVMNWVQANEEIVPTDVDFRLAGHTRAIGRRNGLALELPDCLIAAVASRLELPLVTGNTSDFEAIQKTGLPFKVENWRGNSPPNT